MHCVWLGRKAAEGYTSNIDEAYFYHCKSFAINFTARLRNFVSPEFIHSTVFQTLHVSDCYVYTGASETILMKMVETYVNAKA